MRTPTWKSDIGDVTTAIRKYCNYHLPSGAESATVLNVKKIRGSEPCWVADIEYSYGYQNGEKMTTIQQEEFPCDSEIFMYSSRRNTMKQIKSSKNETIIETNDYKIVKTTIGNLEFYIWSTPDGKTYSSNHWNTPEEAEKAAKREMSKVTSSRKSIKSSQSNMWEEGYQAYYDGEGYADYPTGLSQSEAEDWMSGYDFANKEDQAGHSPIKQSIKSSVGTYNYDFFYDNLKDNSAFEEYRVRFDDDAGEDNIHSKDNAVALKMVRPDGKVYTQPRGNYLQFWYGGWRFNVGNNYGYKMKYSEIENATITGNKLIIDIEDGTHLEFGLDGTISNSKKLLKSSFNYYDGFEDDVKFFAERYADDDNIVESVAGDIENDHPTESPEEFESLMRAVHEELKRQGYFKQPWQVNSALDTIKVTFDNGDVITTDYNADVGREEIAKYYYGNWFNVGDENEMHKVVKVEFPGAENINSNKEPADMDMAYQLEGYIESDGDLYRQMIVPVIKNLERKVQKGIYDYDKSLIAWQHVADEGARRYVKELGGPSYNVATRKEVAKKLSEYYEENYMGDNPISSSRITSSNEDKADENGPHMKFKTLDPDYEFELREQIEDELEILLNKFKINFTTDVWEETVQYILSYFKEDNAYNPKNVKQAVHEWYLETKEYFPEMFDTKKQKLASARYIRWIISKTCI